MTDEQRMKEPIGITCPHCQAKVGQKCFEDGFGVYQHTFHNARIDAASRLPKAEQPAHDLYKDGDENIPDVILDRNGQVELDLCKRCGRAEVELIEPCIAKPVAPPVEEGEYDPICQLPSCGHPLSMHDDGEDGCTAPSDFSEKDYGGEIRVQPTPCICSKFRSTPESAEEPAPQTFKEWWAKRIIVDDIYNSYRNACRLAWNAAKASSLFGDKTNSAEDVVKSAFSKAQRDTRDLRTEENGGVCPDCNRDKSFCICSQKYDATKASSPAINSALELSIPKATTATLMVIKAATDRELSNRGLVASSPAAHEWLGCEEANGWFVASCSCGWTYQHPNYGTTQDTFVNHWGDHIRTVQLPASSAVAGGESETATKLLRDVMESHPGYNCQGDCGECAECKARKAAWDYLNKAQPLIKDIPKGLL